MLGTVVKILEPLLHLVRLLGNRMRSVHVDNTIANDDNPSASERTRETPPNIVSPNVPSILPLAVPPSATLSLKVWYWHLRSIQSIQDRLHMVQTTTRLIKIFKIFREFISVST